MTRERVTGWVHDALSGQSCVTLLITANDKLLARVLADRPRLDVRDAGIGDGRCGFDLEIKGLSPFETHVIAVQRESDMAHVDCSPVLLEPVSQFDAAFRAQCAALLRDAPDDAGLTERIDFLAEQAEALMQQRAHRRSRPVERTALRQVKWRWTGSGPQAGAMRPDQLLPRALVIDETLPVLSRDAGSNAVLSHMRSLQRLGFEVNFVATDMARDTTGVLDDAGIIGCHAPWHGSVEEVLRREHGSFDLVYLHRATVAASYLGLVRREQPRARVVYSVADLHHLRFARQARAEERPEMMALARRFQLVELRAAAAVDAVITHSSHEAAVLRQHVDRAQIHVIPWAVAQQPTEVPFSARHGLAFIGHYGHAPNLEAARWLVDEIMPRIHASDPGIPCLLAGSNMPDDLRRARPGVEVIGQVDSLSAVFDRVRLTVAPMLYGAGIKGKVLESLAWGVPCSCTPVAAEGLDLPPSLDSLVSVGVENIAANAIRLHQDEAFNRACREAGLSYTAATLSEARIDALMRDAAGLPTDRATALGADPG
ncbi:glycosyltransferase [Acidisoma cellulosilytica]|uniref:Glycosyltransferase n=1 Tax=Acidisoma cellulosilyticum TaxID=2802395 RepID=A0A963Z5B3_9PROT|nr:glycosyltransferase [Acidisoma cellulosilyticum]MCB8882731.1 glycosyltransferase [Acidisoma cellulosilyticum]